MARLTTPSLALSQDSYEAIVVGSGFGGAVAACRLSQAGVSVALLERGRRFEPGSFPRPARADTMYWHRGGPYDVRPLNDVLVVQAAGYGGGSLVRADTRPCLLGERRDSGRAVGAPAPVSSANASRRADRGRRLAFRRGRGRGVAARAGANGG